MSERGFEREERAIREVRAYDARDAMHTRASLGVRSTIDQIIPERLKRPSSLDDSGSVPAASFGDDIVELAGILTEGEAE